MNRRRLLAAVVVAALVAVGLGTWLDSRSYDAILSRVEAAETHLVAFNADAKSLSTRYNATTLPSQQDEIRAEVKVLANNTLEEVIVDRARVREARVWPWDRDAMRARDRYSEHLIQWESLLRKVADGQRVESNAAINASSTLACDAIFGAKPLLGSYSERLRVLESHCTH